jgi:hypothetical protein
MNAPYRRLTTQRSISMTAAAHTAMSAGTITALARPAPSSAGPIVKRSTPRDQRPMGKLDLGNHPSIGHVVWKSQVPGGARERFDLAQLLLRGFFFGGWRRPGSLVTCKRELVRHHGLSGRGRQAAPPSRYAAPVARATRRAAARLRCHSTAPPSGATRIISATAARRGPLAFRGPQFMQCSHPHPEKGDLKGGFGWLAGLHRGRFQFDSTVVVCL